MKEIRSKIKKKINKSFKKEKRGNIKEKNKVTIKEVKLKIKTNKHNIIWGSFFALTISIVILNQILVTNPKYINNELIPLYKIFLMVSISFSIIFIIFSFVKWYFNGKNRIEKFLDSTKMSGSNWIIFSVISFGINVDIILLINTNAVNYIFTFFPQGELVIKEFLKSLGEKEFGEVYKDSFANNIVFQLIFSSIGSGILIFLKYLRTVEQKKNSEKYPGTRLLMLFFFFSFIGILISIQNDPLTESMMSYLDLTITNLVILTIAMSAFIYIMDKRIFSNIK